MLDESSGGSDGEEGAGPGSCSHTSSAEEMEVEHDDEDEDGYVSIHPHLVENPPRRIRRRRGPDAKAGSFCTELLALVVPVSLVMIAVVWAVVGLTRIFPDEENHALPMIYNEHQSDSTTQKLEGATLNSITLVAVLAAMAFAIVLLFRYNCYAVLYLWLVTSNALILYFLAWIFLDLTFTRYQVPYDKVTMGIFLWNFGNVGVLAIYGRGHPWLQRGYLVAISIILAWILTRLPQWTTWALLVALCVYDAYAVLAPNGPIRALISGDADSADSSGSGEPEAPIPGLVYETAKHKLGLGDLVFYSLLVGRAAKHGFHPWVVCFVAVIIGLCCTLILVEVFDKPLPALPLSIVLGMLFFFSTFFSIAPYHTFLIGEAVLI